MVLHRESYHHGSPNIFLYCTIHIKLLPELVTLKVICCTGRLSSNCETKPVDLKVRPPIITAPEHSSTHVQSSTHTDRQITQTTVLGPMYIKTKAKTKVPWHDSHELVLGTAPLPLSTANL